MPDQPTTNQETPPIEEDYFDQPFKWGYMDKLGQLSINTVYDEGRDFSEGFAVVRMKGRWGIIDKKGNYVLNPTYKAIWSYKNGFARFQTFNDKIGFLNQKGVVVIKPIYADAKDFSNGYAAIKINEQWGYINQEGALKIPHHYEKAAACKSDYCIVKKEGLYAVLDKDGNEKIGAKYNRITYDESTGWFRVKKDGKYGFINTSLSTKVPFEYASLSSFENGVSVVSKNGLFGMINTSNKVIFPIASEYIRYVGENRWVVQQSGKQMIIDKEGNEISSNIFDEIHDFKNGLAAYRKGDLWGFILPNGELAFEPVFGLAWDFKEGLARVATEENFCYITKSGQIAISLDFRDMRDFSEDLALIQQW